MSNLKDHNKGNIHLMNGDSAERLKELSENSIDSIVCDPPAGIGFMGRAWDDDKGGRNQWINWLSEIMKEVHRVLKPGAYGLVWALPRTSHWTGMALEEAGFEIRDCINHIFGQGFPKSYNIGKAIEASINTGKSNPKALKEVEQSGNGTSYKLKGKNNGILGETVIYNRKEYTPTVEQAKQFKGYGTSLKPAHEMWFLIRKPIAEPTIAKNVLKYGTGGLNIDACRIGEEIITINGQGNDNLFHGGSSDIKQNQQLGRFPANVILGCSCKVKPVASQEQQTMVENQTGVGGKKGYAGTRPKQQIAYRKPREIGKKLNTQERGYGYKRVERTNIVDTAQTHEASCVCAILDQQSGNKCGQIAPTTGKEPSASKPNKVYNDYSMVEGKASKPREPQLGGASRFFQQIESNLVPFIYLPKASTKDRNSGLEASPDKIIEGRDEGQDKRNVPYKKRNTPTKNVHPTVKNTKLMAYLIKLITPPDGTVLDCFMGSGSTGVAAKQLGFKFIGVELNKEYFKIAKKRIKGA